MGSREERRPTLGKRMFQIGKPRDDLRLLHWTKELPRASEADPLGLELRVSARISNELLYCITSITPRARYYAFFPWAIQNYADREEGTKRDRGNIPGLLARERAMVLGSVLTHGGVTCEGGALGGSGKAVKLTTKEIGAIDLLAWRHLQNPQGQFGAAYKGSLINLGIFETDDGEVSDEASVDTDELDEMTQSVEIRGLSKLGRRLAAAFDEAVGGTAYVAKDLTLTSRVSPKILSEFGEKGCLCKVASRSAKDRGILRDVFFANCPELNRSAQKNTHHRRRMSLLLFMNCVARCRSAGVWLDDRALSDVCYFDAVVADDETGTVVPIALPVELRDIQQRWRIFFTQSYMTVALQSLLVVLVRQLRGRPSGSDRDDLIDLFRHPELPESFAQEFGGDPSLDFFAMTPRETLEIFGSDFSGRDPVLPSIENEYSERGLESRLTGAVPLGPYDVVPAVALLYQVIMRHSARGEASFDNWYLQHVSNQFADISLPGIVRFIETEFGADWLDEPNDEIVSRLLWRFVIRQHQTMSYERGFGGVAPLFHVDGTRVIATETDYSDPSARNPRLRSAMQILTDLNLLDFDDDGYRLTPDGRRWLASQLATGEGS